MSTAHRQVLLRVLPQEIRDVVLWPAKVGPRTGRGLSEGESGIGGGGLLNSQRAGGPKRWGSGPFGHGASLLVRFKELVPGQILLRAQMCQTSK